MFEFPHEYRDVPFDACQCSEGNSSTERSRGVVIAHLCGTTLHNVHRPCGELGHATVDFEKVLAVTIHLRAEVYKWGGHAVGPGVDFGVAKPKEVFGDAAR